MKGDDGGSWHAISMSSSIMMESAFAFIFSGDRCDMGSAMSAIGKVLSLLRVGVMVHSASQSGHCVVVLVYTSVHIVALPNAVTPGLAEPNARPVRSNASWHIRRSAKI